MSPCIYEDRGKLGSTILQSKASVLLLFTWPTYIWRYCFKVIRALGKYNCLHVLHLTDFYRYFLPCLRCRYIINFLLDSTIGLFIIYIGIQVCTFLSRSMKWDAINFGEYGKYLLTLVASQSFFLIRLQELRSGNGSLK